MRRILRQRRGSSAVERGVGSLREAAQAKGSPLSDAERNEVYMRFDNEILF
jgi:hypothetical protein